MGKSSRLKQVDQPQVMRRRSGAPVVAVLEEDGVVHVYPLIEVPAKRYIPAIERLEIERCAIFESLAPIVGHDALTDLLADFDIALADLRRERDQ